MDPNPPTPPPSEPVMPPAPEPPVVSDSDTATTAPADGSEAVPAGTTENVAPQESVAQPEVTSSEPQVIEPTTPAAGEVSETQGPVDPTVS